MHEVRDVPVKRNAALGVFKFWTNSRRKVPWVWTVLLNGQRVRPRDRQLVEEHEELAEGLEEGPAGQQADALVGVHRPVGDHLLFHRCEHAQLDLLLLI